MARIVAIAVVSTPVLCVSQLLICTRNAVLVIWYHQSCSTVHHGNTCTVPICVPVGTGVSVGVQNWGVFDPDTQSLYARARTMIVSNYPFY